MCFFTDPRLLNLWNNAPRNKAAVGYKANRLRLSTLLIASFCELLEKELPGMSNSETRDLSPIPKVGDDAGYLQID